MPPANKVFWHWWLQEQSPCPPFSVRPWRQRINIFSGHSWSWNINSWPPSASLQRAECSSETLLQSPGLGVQKVGVGCQLPPQGGSSSTMQATPLPDILFQGAEVAGVPSTLHTWLAWLLKTYYTRFYISVCCFGGFRTNGRISLLWEFCVLRTPAHPH